MMNSFDASARQLFWGNLLFVACCGFYLAWWLLAFRPVGAVKGMKSGWLLLPAFAAGVTAVWLLACGIRGGAAARALFPISWIVWGGVAAYLLLMAVTLLLWKRPVTTELILIVAWAALALMEVHALCGADRFPGRTAAFFACVIAAALVADLACYLLYYRLGARAAYLDGAVPLLLAALTMAGLTIRMAMIHQ